MSLVHSISRKQESNSTIVRVVVNQFQTYLQTAHIVVQTKMSPNISNKEREGLLKKKRFLYKRKRKSIQKPFMLLATRALMKRSKNSDMMRMIWKSIGMKISLEPRQRSKLHTTEEWLKKRWRWMKKRPSLL